MPDDGDADEVLKTDGSGNLDWVAQSGGTVPDRELVWDAASLYCSESSNCATTIHDNTLLVDILTMAYDDTTDMSKMARYAMEFCAIESCGKCTPCRIGSTRGAEVIDRLVAGQDRKKQEALLRDLCDTMTSASLCAMGGLTPLPVLSALDHFPEDFAKV